MLRANDPFLDGIGSLKINDPAVLKVKMFAQRRLGHGNGFLAFEFAFGDRNAGASGFETSLGLFERQAHEFAFERGIGPIGDLEPNLQERSLGVSLRELGLGDIDKRIALFNRGLAHGDLGIRLFEVGGFSSSIFCSTALASKSFSMRLSTDSLYVSAAAASSNFVFAARASARAFSRVVCFSRMSMSVLRNSFIML